MKKSVLSRIIHTNKEWGSDFLDRNTRAVQNGQNLFSYYSDSLAFIGRNKYDLEFSTYVKINGHYMDLLQ